ncbi:unnamed protein product [Closterium sp. NIES-54]
MLYICCRLYWVPSCPLFFVALPYQKFLYCPLHCRAAALPCPAGYRAALPKPTRCRSVQCARLPTAPHAARNDARSPHAARALPALPTRSPHCLRAALCCPRPPARCLHTARPSSAALRTALHVCLPCPSPPACALPEPAPLHYARACPAPRRLRAPCLSRLRIALPAPCPVLRCCAASSRPVPLPVLPPAAAASPLPCPRYSRPAEPPCQAAQPSRPAKPPSRAALLSRIAQPPLLPPLLLLLLLLLLPLLPLLPPLPLLLSLPLLLLWRLPLCSPLMPRSTRSILSPGCLALPFLFPELSDFTTVADLMTHLRSLDTRYRAALESDFLAANNPFIAESAALAVAASRGTPLPLVFEGCSPSLLTPSVASAAAVDVLRAEEAGTASAPSWRRRSGKGNGGKGGGGRGSGGGGRGGGGGGGGGGGCSGRGGGGGWLSGWSWRGLSWRFGYSYYCIWWCSRWWWRL